MTIESRSALSLDGLVQFARTTLERQQIPADELELEARFRLSVDEAVALLRALEGCDKHAVERMIEFATEPAGRDRVRDLVRQTLKVEKGRLAPQGTSYLQKSELASTSNLFDGVQHKVHLSQERPLKAPPRDSLLENMRLKLRFSCDLGGWRVDLTFMSVHRRHDWARLPEPERRRRLEAALNSEPSGAHLQTFTGASLEVERTAPLGLLQPEELQATLKRVLRMVAPHAEARKIAAHGLAEVAPFFMEGLRLERFLGRPGFKQFLPQVRALTRNAYLEIFPPTGFLVTDKADGEIAACVVGERARIVMARAQLEVEPRGGGRREACAVVGEIIWKDPAAAPSAANIRLFLLFDMTRLADRSLLGLDFADRLRGLEERAADLRATFKIPAYAKAFRELSADPRELEAAYRGALGAAAPGEAPYEKDGLVLYHPRGGFWETRMFKWKPVEKITLDFLARLPPKQLLGVPPYAGGPPGHTLLLLYVGVQAGYMLRMNMARHPRMGEMFPQHALLPGGGREYIPVQFSPPDLPFAYLWWCDPATLGGVAPEALDGRVVELGVEPGRERLALASGEFVRWVFHRVREDRAADSRAGTYFGNDLTTTALPSWLSLTNPLPLEQLWGAGGGYFGETSAAYHALRRYNRFVSGRLIREYLHGAPLVLDLGGGRGADLPRYAAARVANVLFADLDRDALAELVLRRLGAIEKADPKERLGVYTLRADLQFKTEAAGEAAGARVREMLRDIHAQDRTVPAGHAPHALANFSLHYFGVGADAARFAQFLRGVVAPGGYFVATVLNGERVHALLRGKAVGESWEAREAGAALPKYQIERRYREPGANATIAVLHPFSQGELYEEPLALLDRAFFQAYKAQGFELVRRAPFEEFIGEFKESREGELFHRLTQSAADLEYMRLYEAIVLRRTEAKTRATKSTTKSNTEGDEENEGTNNGNKNTESTENKSTESTESKSTESTESKSTESTESKSTEGTATGTPKKAKSTTTKSKK